MPPDSAPEWDLFISHASEDKQSLVAPLAEVLRGFGVRVWYDQFTLSVGDSLSRSIDRGLASSRFGVVVLSKHFFAKKWPEYELRGLVAREMRDGKVILPLWHGVTHADVTQFSPPLADKLALDSAGISTTQLAVRLIEVVRPDLFTGISRRLAHLRSTRGVRPTVIKSSRLVPSPIRHTSLPEDLIRRIRLVRIALLEVYPSSMKDWVEGFQRDTHPTDEVRSWERIAAAYLEYRDFMGSKLSKEQRHQAFRALLRLSTGIPFEIFEAECEGLPKGAPKLLFASLASENPIVDVEVTQTSDGDRDDLIGCVTVDNAEDDSDIMLSAEARDLLEEVYREAKRAAQRDPRPESPPPAV